jgi:hypothetical protein
MFLTRQRTAIARCLLGLALVLATSAAGRAAMLDPVFLQGRQDQEILSSPMESDDTLTIFGQATGKNSLFQHDVFFKVTRADGAGGATATPNTLIINNVVRSQITDLRYGVYRPGLESGPSSFVSSPELLAFSNLVPESVYAIRFMGLATGTAGGSYTGEIAVTPLPASLAMLVAACLGLWVLRVRQRGRQGDPI